MPDLSINICTYNNEKFLQSCLNSVYEKIKNVELEVIVVDNGSKDGTCHMVKTNFPGVILLENKVNYGVAKARNISILESRGRYILLLDADTEIVSGNFQDILGYMDDSPDVGLLGVKQVTFDDKPYAAARTFPGIRHIIARRLSFVNVVKKSRIMQDHHIITVDDSGPVIVDYVIGAFQIIRKTVFDSIGLLDERMFYGFEDAEFCARLKKKGFKVVYYPAFTIRHFVQGLTRKSVFTKTGMILLLNHFKSFARFYIKHHDVLAERKNR